MEGLQKAIWIDSSVLSSFSVSKNRPPPPAMASGLAPPTLKASSENRRMDIPFIPEEP